jgi:hypothetical protein
MAITVALRRKGIKKEMESLYLDYYPPIPHPKTGKITRREYLGFYLYENPKNQIEKKQNKQVWAMAEQIRNNRFNEYNKPEIYSGEEQEKIRIKVLGETEVMGYFKELADQRKASNYDNWVSAASHLQVFMDSSCGGSLRFNDLTEDNQ